MAQDSVKSLMNTMVISVLPETSVLTAIDIILTNNFNGIPVTDSKGALIGILTKYDLITKRASLMDDTKVNAVMNADPFALNENDSVEDAVKAFSEHHKVDPIPVINGDRKVVGVISRYDMVKMFGEYGVSFSSTSKDKYPVTNSTASFGRLYVIVVAIVAGVAYFLLK